MYKFISCLIFFLFVACSPEKPAQSVSQGSSGSGVDTPGTQLTTPSGKEMYVLELVPKEVDRTGTLDAVAHGFSPSEIQWLVNGRYVSSAIPLYLKGMDAKKGDTLQARTTFQSKEIVSDRVTIKNAPPKILRVKFMPEVFKPGDLLYIEVEAEDADKDEVTITYEWSINGVPAGTDKKIGGPIKRGDKVVIKITTFDKESYGTPVVMTREIRNLPPMIVEDRNFSVKGNLFAYQVKAADPDGDTLVYTLKSAPQGMTMDSANGLIAWQVPAKFTEKAPVTVTVSDGHGGEATYSFVVDIKEVRQK